MIKWFDSRKVGGKLESRVIKWFDYLWANKNSMDEEMVLNMLPEKLKVRFRVSIWNYVESNLFLRLFDILQRDILLVNNYSSVLFIT